MRMRSPSDPPRRAAPRWYVSPWFLVAAAAAVVVWLAFWIPALAAFVVLVALVLWLALGPRAPVQVDPPATHSPTDRHVEAQPFQPGPGLFQHDVPDAEPEPPRPPEPESHAGPPRPPARRAPSEPHRP